MRYDTDATDYYESALTLGDVIFQLSVLRRDQKVPQFVNGHSYRGYYECLAVEPTGQLTSVDESIRFFTSLDGQTFRGWNGGEFRMSRQSRVFIATEGACGDPMTYMRLMHLDQIRSTPAPSTTTDVDMSKPTPTTRYVIIGNVAATDFDSGADPDAVVVGLLFRRLFSRREDAERVATAYPHRRPQIIPGQWLELQAASREFVESYLPLRKP